jgi:hypothetical protein
MNCEAAKKRCPNIAWAFWHARELKLDPRERLILMAIAERADADGYCAPTQSTLAEDTGLSARTVYNAVADLVHGRKDENGDRRNPPGCVEAQRHRDGLQYKLVRPAHRDARSTAPAPENETGPIADPVPQNLPIPTPPELAKSATPESQNLPVQTLATPAGLAKSATPESQNLPIPIKSPLKSPLKEDTLLRNGDAAAPPTVSEQDIRKMCWDEGKTILRELTGQLATPAGRQIGWFLKTANDNCAVVLESMRAALRERPPAEGVIGFITNGIKARMRQEPVYRLPANQMADAMGQLEKQARESLASGLTIDYSGFGKGAAQ